MENSFNQLANSWNQPESESRIELVFNDRFKEYGAYQIRKSYRSRIILATIIACVFSLFLSSLPIILDKVGKDTKPKKKLIFVVENIDDIKDPEEEIEKPKDLPKPKEPEMQQDAYVAPRINPEATKEADILPPDLIDNPSDKNVKGEKDPTFPDPNEAGGPTGGGDDDKGEPKTAQVKATFPGGESKFREYVQREFQYPVRCQDEGINGYVVLRFIVDSKGKISDIKVIEETKTCPEFTTEAIRILQKSPRWVPGQNNGRFIKSYREIPIKLSVQE
jgi:protein TonB